MRVSSRLSTWPTVAPSYTIDIDAEGLRYPFHLICKLDRALHHLSLQKDHLGWVLIDDEWPLLLSMLEEGLATVQKHDLIAQLILELQGLVTWTGKKLVTELDCNQL